MSEHAKLSPSSAHRWIHCPGSPVLEAGQPDTAGRDAAEGTAAHALAAMALTEGKPASAYIGHVFNGNGYSFGADEDMARHVQAYADYVQALGGTLFVENRLPIDHLTGEPGAMGTADAVVFTPNGELVVVDLKYGKGVRVEAQDNAQLIMYALAAMREFDFLGTPARVRVAIYQPRLDHISEHAYTIEEMVRWAERIQRGAEACTQAGDRYHGMGGFAEGDLRPGDGTCRWCRAKAVCPALAAHVMNLVADDFVDLDKPIVPRLEQAHERTMDNATLGRLREAVPLVELWCRAISAKVEAELLEGRAVPGWKLVRGKRGSRTWTDEDMAAELLLGAGVDADVVMPRSLVSPTTLEKAMKAGAIAKGLWENINGLIMQPEGRAVAAPADDRREAVDAKTVTADCFDNLDT